jgi:hypothetical protein
MNSRRPSAEIARTMMYCARRDIVKRSWLNTISLGGSTNREMTTIGKVGETGQLRASRWASQVALERLL